MSRLWRALLCVPLCLLLGTATMWAAGALYFDLPIAWLRAPLALTYGLAMLAAPFFVKGRWRAMGVVAVGIAVVLGWWLTDRKSVV